MNDEIRKLITKAVDAEKSDDALKFSQAALNAANALREPPSPMLDDRDKLRDTREALAAVRRAITSPANKLSIICTVWMDPTDSEHETVVDFVDQTLEDTQ